MNALDLAVYLGGAFQFDFFEIIRNLEILFQTLTHSNRNEVSVQY